MTSWQPVIPPPAQQQPPSFRRDLFWAYAASFAKIASWVIVSALLFRANPADFAIFALLRATIGILNYTGLGLGPAMVRLVAPFVRRTTTTRPEETVLVEASSLAENTTAPIGLQYARTDLTESAHTIIANDPSGTPVQQIHSNSLSIGWMAGATGVFVTGIYALIFNHIHTVPSRLQEEVIGLVIIMGVGVIIRLFSDIQGTMMQMHGKIALDNICLTITELTWVTFFMLLSRMTGMGVGAEAAVIAYFIASAILFVLRTRWVETHTASFSIFPVRSLVRWPIQKALLGYGAVITLGQLADYLYAPVDYILINTLLGWRELATYAPAVQIDAALLILVTALSTVLLPRAALAHAQGPEGQKTVWKYYLRGTLASAALLASAGALVWLLSPWIFKLWLGSEMPATQAILPLVLIHTIAGGSSAVGRSILLATGRARAFTISVLIAGLANVILSYIFVRHANLGLPGIIYGTITVVVARCVVWMPWYVRRALAIPTP